VRKVLEQRSRKMWKVVIWCSIFTLSGFECGNIHRQSNGKRIKCTLSSKGKAPHSRIFLSCSMIMTFEWLPFVSNIVVNVCDDDVQAKSISTTLKIDFLNCPWLMT
jgi:hypothetical protein